LGVGGGGGQGRVGGEGRPASPWESGVGYWLEGRRVCNDFDLSTLRVRRLDVVMIVGDERWGGVDDGEGDGGGGDDGGRGGRRGP